MIHGATAPIEGHDYDTGKPCPVAGCISRNGLPRHHYSCADCGADCTAGMFAGPGCTDTRGVTRCNTCEREWGRERCAISPWSRDELEAIKVALSQIADDGDPLPVTETQRKMATTLLCRHENRSGW